MESKNLVNASYPSFFSQLFHWWFLEVPKNIYHGTIRVVINSYNYFSVKDLARTLFAPWKRDIIDTSNLSLAQRLQVMIMNLVSRFFGAIVRLVTIFTGLLIILIEFSLGIAWLVVFVISPLFSVFIIVLQFFI